MKEKDASIPLIVLYGKIAFHSPYFSLLSKKNCCFFLICCWKNAIESHCVNPGRKVAENGVHHGSPCWKMFTGLTIQFQFWHHKLLWIIITYSHANQTKTKQRFEFAAVGKFAYALIFIAANNDCNNNAWQTIILSMAVVCCLLLCAFFCAEWRAQLRNARVHRTCVRACNS